MKNKRRVVLVLAVIIVGSLFYSLSILQKNNNAKSEGKIGIIYIDGVIVGGRTQNMLGEYNGTDLVMKQLRQAAEDNEVKAVVLRINSPGGSAPASQEVAEEVKKLKAAGKPVITSMGDVAASGGYWIAAVTDKIYANPATITGSIGVYMPYANWQELYKKIGIANEKIKSGPHKDILSPDRPISNEERKIVQSMVDDMYEQFITVVAEGRKLDVLKVRQLADGRIYTGNQAKTVGLVDEMGNLYDAIDEAKSIAGIEGKAEIKEFGHINPLAVLLGAQSGDSKTIFYQQLLKSIQSTLQIPSEYTGGL